ncbi:SRPBCC family protein [Leucobacter sp. UT-8R-CII-1-4]|uniref:SRPBCC family protein n=1 Tax=Leucobacter sp. UT-8R-CII-1-4 TaxID=3040075 RepID=UPI0024A950AE|nr:SRPBCC family protein [Leucobacter sp. UT-8R-CII-1-4]MDI6023192.1 SRPBCC family protein [Leucobacter sp. UT-8R-CII-1-4]
MRLITTHTAATSHSAQSVFSLWADPAGWPSWDSEVSEVHFAGIAKLGAQGQMRPASGPATTFSITAYEQDRVFTNTSSLPGATLIFDHKVAPTNDGATLQVSIGVDGFLAPLWQRLLHKSMKSAARSSVTGLLEHLDAA